MAAFGQQLEEVVSTPKVPEWEQIATAVLEHAEMAIRKEKTMTQTLISLDAKADQILAKRRWVLARQKAPGQTAPLSRLRTDRADRSGGLAR